MQSTRKRSCHHNRISIKIANQRRNYHRVSHNGTTNTVYSCPVIRRVPPALPFSLYYFHGNFRIETSQQKCRLIGDLSVLQLSLATYTVARHNTHENRAPIWIAAVADQWCIVDRTINRTTCHQEQPTISHRQQFVIRTTAISMGQQRSIHLHPANCVAHQCDSVEEESAADRCISGSFARDF